MMYFKENVKSSVHGDSAILYNLNEDHFFKMPRKGWDFLENFIKSNGRGNDLLATLNEDEHKNFLTLLEYLKKKEYIIDGPAEIYPNKYGKKSKQEFFTVERNAYYEVINKCNLNCIFCYDSPNYTPDQVEGDLALSKRIIDKARQLNITRIAISGGEPLLRKDIFKLITYVKKKMDSAILVTNGILIDKTAARKLKETGIDGISISLESSRKDVHESLRGKGTFEKTLNAVHWLKDAGFDKKSLTITATITRKNYHTLNEMPKFAEELGVKMNFSTFEPVGKGRLHDELALTPKQFIEFILGLKNHTVKKKKNGSQGDNCENCASIKPRLKNMCGLVEKSLGIKSNGELVPCHLFFSVDSPDMIIGHILDESIEEKLWEFYIEKIPAIDEKEGCKECNVRYFCGGECAAPSYFKNGSLYTPHPFCERYKIYYSAVADSLGSKNEMETLRENIKSRLNR